MGLFENAARLFVLLLGLLLPGMAVLRALRLPGSLAAAFVVSTLVLSAAVVAFSLVGLRISWSTLFFAIALVTAASSAFARRRTMGLSTTVKTPGRDWLIPFAGMGRWTLLYLAFWAIIIFRAWQQPLSGPDTEFRWSWLAEQMLRHGSLGFYPPRQPADFATYFWVESIPPGVASLYAWVYACAGSFDPRWTAPVVLLQFWALHELLWRIANQAAGPTAARLACLAAAACPLLNWSLLIGQETGLATIALLGLLWILVRPQPQRSEIILAGLFAALGTFVREYALVFPLFGFVVLLAKRTPRHLLTAFLAASLPLCLVWLARTGVLTGNPLYSLEVGRLFPTNELFTTWRQHDRGLHSVTVSGVSGVMAVFRLLVLFAPLALLGWLLLVVHRGWQRSLLLASVGLFIALWWVSVPFTSGGLFYSLRVAAPAIAVGALVAAGGLARLPARLGGLLLASLMVITLPQTLTLPQNAWRISYSQWNGRAAQQATRAVLDQEAKAVAAAIGDGGTVVTDSPGFQARLASHRITVLPPWSPPAAWLFEPKLPAADVIRRWHEQPMRFLLLAKFLPTLDFINARARWNAPPLAYRIAWQDEHWVLYELTLTAP